MLSVNSKEEALSKMAAGASHSAVCKISFPWKQLSSSKAKDISQMIRIGTNPIQVNLIGNDLADEGTEIVAESLEENDKVDELNISCNRISVKGATALSKFVRTSRTIRELSLFGNKIRDGGAIAIATSLRYNTSLQVLNLSYNHISCEGAIALAKGIYAHRSLVRVDLSGNSIGDEGASALATACTLLDDLTLSRNHVGDLGAMAFASVLSREGCRLQHLRLAGNNVGPTGARALSLSLKCNKTLLTLDLRFSELLYSTAREGFLEVMHGNTTLTSCQLVQSMSHQLQSELNYFANLNKAGRQIARSRVDLLALVLGRVNDDPTLMYGLLSESPHVWAALENN